LIHDLFIPELPHGDDGRLGFPDCTFNSGHKDEGLVDLKHNEPAHGLDNMFVRTSFVYLFTDQLETDSAGNRSFSRQHVMEVN